MLYYDEVEIANPLGSKAAKHKLGKKTESQSSLVIRVPLAVDYSTNYWPE
jgi:hypothetical protein